MDALYELIKSLSKSEKVHFKKYISVHTYKSKPAHFILYELIEKSNTFDEKKYKKKIGEKKYSLAKFTLYDIILKALRDFHEKGTDFAKMINLLISIEILISKDLISQAENLNQKAKKIAVENEDYFLLCKILQNEFKFLTVPKKLPKDIEQNQTVFDLYKKSIQQLDYLGVTLKQLSQFIIPIRQSYNKKNPLHTEIIQEAKLSINNIISKKDNSIWVKMNCYRIQGTIASFEGNIDDNIDANQKIVNFLESKPTFLENNPRGIIGAYRNLFGASIQGKKWKLAEEIINKLENYLNHKSIVKNKKVKGYVLETYLSAAGYLFAIKPKIYSEFQEKYISYKEKLKENKLLINTLREDSIIITHYYLGIISFRLNKYEECLQNISQYKILKRDTNRFIRIEASIIVLQLICLFETEEVEVTENLLRSINRSENNYLDNNKLVSESLNFVKRTIKGESLILETNIKNLNPVNEFDNALKEWLLSKK